MTDMAFPHHNYDDMTVEQLATIREYGLERVHTVTESLKTAVKREHGLGVNIKKLSRQAGVSRPTIYAWLAE
jgi:hypothetical protein